MSSFLLGGPAGPDSLPILTIFDSADPPAKRLLNLAGPILEVGGRAGRNLWAARLDEAVRLAEQPVVLVAHGVSCFAVAWWARLSPTSYVSKVAGALFVGPLGKIAAPEQRFAGPTTLVPFPSILADRAAEARDLARSWGSRFVETRAVSQVGELVAMLRGNGADAVVLPATPAAQLAR
jgi:hypothetical protein